MVQILNQTECGSYLHFLDKLQEITGLHINEFRRKAAEPKYEEYRYNGFALKSECGQGLTDFHTHTLSLDIFTDEFLEEIGLNYNVKRKTSEFKPHQIYGKCTDRTGMTTMEWNEEGPTMTYFGVHIMPAMYVGVKKDGGTRTAFSGYIHTQEDLKTILKLTW